MGVKSGVGNLEEMEFLSSGRMELCDLWGWAGEAVLGAGAAALLFNVNENKSDLLRIVGRIAAQLCLLIESSCLCLNSCVRGEAQHPLSCETPPSPSPLPVFGDIWCCRLSSSIPAPLAVTGRRGGTKTKDVTNLSFSLS